MQIIDNQTTQANYANALTVGPDNFEALSVSVWNATVAAQFFTLGSNGDWQVGGWGDEILLAPSAVTVERCGGARFRTNPATPASVGQINAYAWKEGEPVIGGGLQLTGTLATTGAFIPGGNVITGSVSSAGALVAGSGFAPVRNAQGDYTITFTTAFASPPVILVTMFPAGASVLIPALTTVAVGSFRLQVLNAGGGSTDGAFLFTAQAMS